MQKKKEPPQETEPLTEHDAQVQAEAASFQLAEFDVNKINLDSLILVIGKRRYGKTTWSRWILSQMADMFPRGAYVFTSTKHNYFWQQHVPDSRVYDGFQPTVVQRLMEEQKEVYEKFLEGTIDKNTIPYVCLILDDVIGDHDLRYDEIFDTLAFSGRHYFIFCIVNTQDIKGINPKIRQNADIVAFTYQTQDRSIEQIAKDYADIFADKDTFKEVIKRNTQDFQLVIIDQANAHYDVQEAFFISRAEEEVEPFKLGGFDFWKESGCEWKEQLKKFRNKKRLLDKKKREDWEEIARRVHRHDNKKEKEYQQQQEAGKLDTNQECYAPLELQRIKQQERVKAIGDSHVKMATDRMKKLFHYMPGPAPNIILSSNKRRL